jgi:hypothetical protein
MKSLPNFTVSKENRSTIMAITGRLDAKGVSGLWQDVTQKKCP